MEIVHVLDHNRETRCGIGGWHAGMAAFRWPSTRLTWLTPLPSDALLEEIDPEVLRLSERGLRLCANCEVEVQKLIGSHAANEKRVYNVEVDGSLFDGEQSPRKVLPEYRDYIMSLPRIVNLLQTFEDRLSPEDYAKLRNRLDRADKETSFMACLFEMSLGPVLAQVPGLEVEPSFWDESKPDYILKWPRGRATHTLAVEAKRKDSPIVQLLDPAAQDDLLAAIGNLPGDRWQAKIETNGTPLLKNLKKTDKDNILNWVRGCLSGLDPSDFPGLKPIFSEGLQDAEFAPQAQVNINEMNGERRALQIHLTFYPASDPSSRLFAIGGPAHSHRVRQPDFAKEIKKAAKQPSSTGHPYLIVAIGQLGKPDEHLIKAALYGELAVHSLSAFPASPASGVIHGFDGWLDSRKSVWKPGEQPKPTAVLSCFDALDESEGKPVLWCPPHSDTWMLGPMVQNDVFEARFLRYQWEPPQAIGHVR